MRSELQITKKSMDYITRKSEKCGVYLIWGPFDLENGTVRLTLKMGCFGCEGQLAPWLRS
ncbi:hypothetical protein H5410_029295 [Solanum commersonii]|uniref:Uncharacterized protein n=1 Tax=Solanum commersonii TaxID=4109 RepID=A0A9J5Z4A8_SOLCO|nr:hypothetical protein H5410_029295 [Solanum commersonii]